MVHPYPEVGVAAVVRPYPAAAAVGEGRPCLQGEEVEVDRHQGVGQDQGEQAQRGR